MTLSRLCLFFRSRKAGKGFTAFLLFCFLNPSLVFGLPQGGEVESGAAEFNSPDGNTLNITTSDQVIINWQSFDIAGHETVNFIQPSVTSFALNRVLGGGATNIAGTLNANGGVIIVNPAGVNFAPTAQVRVAALIASSLNIQSNDFLAAQYHFAREGDAPVGMVINQGKILAVSDGFILLLGGAVENTGTMTAELGRVAMASGDRATVTITDNKLVSVAVDEPTAAAITLPDGTPVKDAVANAGEISAPGGKVTLTAEVLSNIFDKAINQTGMIQASSVTEHNGHIELLSETGFVFNTGTLRADGTFANPHAGTIRMEGYKTVQGGEAAANAFDLGKAGKIEIYSEKGTWLLGGSLTEAKADGLRGTGGDVLINAWDGNTYFRSGAVVDISGGGLEGDAGFIELSAKDTVAWNGVLRGLAQEGYAGGRVLIDPNDAVFNTTVQDAPTDNDNGTPDVAVEDAPLAGTTTIEISDVIGFSEIFVQVIQDITLSAAMTMSNNRSVRWEAGRNVNINANLTTSGTGSVTLTADKDFPGRPSDGVGAVITASGTTIRGGSGGINLTGAGITLGGNLSTDAGSTAGAVSLTGPVTLAANVTIDTDAGTDDANITFSSTVNADSAANNRTLTLAAGTGGDVTFNGAVGGTQSLQSLTINSSDDVTLQAVTVKSSISVRADTSASVITLNGAILRQGNVFGEAFSFNGGSTNNSAFIMNAGASLTAGGGNTSDINIVSDVMDIENAANNSITTAGNINIKPKSADRPIVLGAAGTANDFALSAGEIASFSNGATAIRIGVGNSGTGGITVSDATFQDPLTLANSGAGGSITLNGALATTGNALMNLQAGTGNAGRFTMNAGASITTGSGSINIDADVIDIENAADDSIVTTGSLTLRGYGSRPIVVGAAGTADDFALSTTELNSIKTGVNTIILGTSGTGAVTVESVTFRNSVSFSSTAEGGSITLNGALVMSSANPSSQIITVSSGSGNSGLFTMNAGASIAAGGGQLFVFTDSIDIENAADNSITTTGSILLQPQTSNRPIVIGAVGTANDFALSTGELASFSDGASSITIGRSSGTGAVSINTAAFKDPVTIRSPGASGSISVTGQLSATGSSTISLEAGTDGSGTGPITMNAGSSIVSGSGTVTLDAGGDVTIAGISTTGNVNITSRRGNILDDNNASVVAGNTLTLTANTAGKGVGTGANGALDTDVATITANAGGGGIFINETNGVTLTNIDSSSGNGDVTISSGGDMLIGVINAGTGNVILTATNGNINDDVNDSTLDITGASITLAAEGAGKGIGTANGNLDLEGTTLILNTGSGGANVRDLSGVNLGASTVNGNLTLTTGGPITDGGALTVTGTATFTAGAANDITLDTPANNFNVVSIVSGNNITLTDADALDLGASTISGNLVVNAGGAVTQSGVVNVAGTNNLPVAGAAGGTTTPAAATGENGAGEVLSQDIAKAIFGPFAGGQQLPFFTGMTVLPATGSLPGQALPTQASLFHQAPLLRIDRADAGGRWRMFQAKQAKPLAPFSLFMQWDMGKEREEDEDTSEELPSSEVEMHSALANVAPPVASPRVVPPIAVPGMLAPQALSEAEMRALVAVQENEIAKAFEPVLDAVRVSSGTPK